VSGLCEFVSVSFAAIRLQATIKYGCIKTGSLNATKRGTNTGNALQPNPNSLMAPATLLSNRSSFGSTTIKPALGFQVGRKIAFASASSILFVNLITLIFFFHP